MREVVVVVLLETARLDHGPNCQNLPVSSLFKPVNPCDNQASIGVLQINNHLHLQSQASFFSYFAIFWLLASLDQWLHLLLYCVLICYMTFKVETLATMQPMHTIYVQFTCT